MSAVLEGGHAGFLSASGGAPESPPAALADMISRNKMLEGEIHPIEHVTYCYG